MVVETNLIARKCCFSAHAVPLEFLGYSRLRMCIVALTPLDGLFSSYVIVSMAIDYLSKVVAEDGRTRLAMIGWAEGSWSLHHGL